MLNKVSDVKNFFSNILVSLLVLTLYFYSFEYFISSVWLLPDGVNYFFVSKSWKYLLVLAFGSTLVFFASTRFIKGEGSALLNSVGKLSIGDFILLLLPLTPVVQYIINNQDILSLLESLYILVYFVFFSGLYVLAIPALLGVVGPTRMMLIFGLAFVFTITSMASLSGYFAWFETGSFEIQWLVFGGVSLITWLFFRLGKKKTFYLLVVVSFIANTTTQLLAQDDGTEGAPLPIEESRLFTLIEERTPAVTPNIYLLIYDSYVSNETMLAYGIDNSSQEEYLKGQGFALYPHTYSIGASSIRTVSRVLNASTDFFGNPRRAVSGDGIILNTLRGFGYQTYGIFTSEYFFRGIGSSYDFSFPERRSSRNILLSSIFMGEFRFDIVYNNPPRKEFIETKQSVFEGVSENRALVYVHSNLPGHSQNSGACLPDEADQFNVRLEAANIEMRQDIQMITENDPEAIVIVAGDHGPYLTKNCTGTGNDYDISEISRLDIQDRFGTFLAIRWPTEEYSRYDDIVVLQDLFSAVFAYLYNDERFLELKIDPSTSSKNRISGASVQKGIIYGGINDGEPLFVTGQ